MSDMATEFREQLEVIQCLAADFKLCLASLDAGGVCAPDEKAKGFWRRMYARSVFAYLDGVTYNLMFHAWEARSRVETLLTAEEIMQLQKYYDFDEEREAVTKLSQQHMLNNLRFAYRVYAHANYSDHILPIHEPEWETFKEMARIRNRLLYPKKGEDIEVSDENVDTLIDSVNWLVTHLVTLMKDINARVTEKYKEWQANEDEIIM